MWFYIDIHSCGSGCGFGSGCGGRCCAGHGLRCVNDVDVELKWMWRCMWMQVSSSCGGGCVSGWDSRCRVVMDVDVGIKMM